MGRVHPYYYDSMEEFCNPIDENPVAFRDEAKPKENPGLSEAEMYHPELPEHKALIQKVADLLNRLGISNESLTLLIIKDEIFLATDTISLKEVSTVDKWLFREVDREGSFFRDIRCQLAQK